MKRVVKFLILAAILAASAMFALGGGGGDWRRTLGIARTHASNAAHRAGVSVENLQLPGGSPAGGDAIECARQCRENLSRIHTAKAAIRSKTGIEVRDVSWDAILKEMGGGSIPRCPCGGTYKPGTMQERPTCSIGANGTTDRADDHAINN